MRAFWIILGIIGLYICIPILISTSNDYLVYTKGNVVEVTISKLPSIGISSKSSGFMEFIYNGETYQIKIHSSNGFAIGQKLRLKHLEEHKSKFLFENDNPIYGGSIAFLMLFIASIYCFYYAYKKTELPPLIKRRNR